MGKRSSSAMFPRLVLWLLVLGVGAPGCETSAPVAVEPEGQPAVEAVHRADALSLATELAAVDPVIERRRRLQRPGAMRRRRRLRGRPAPGL